jgi:hypothetical protein
MAVITKCEAGRNKGGVTISVTDKQEFLRYRVCITEGAINEAIIVDQNNKIILDEKNAVSKKCLEREWPKGGETVDDGDHVHVLGIAFIKAVEYTYQVTVHNADESLKAWVKDCTYTRSSQIDHKDVILGITVV